MLCGAELGGVLIAMDCDLRVFAKAVVDEGVDERHTLLSPAVFERVQVIDIHRKVVHEVCSGGKSRDSGAVTGASSGDGGVGGRGTSAAVRARGVVVQKEGVCKTKQDGIVIFTVRVHLVDGAKLAVHPIHRRIIRRVLPTRDEVQVYLFTICRRPDVADTQRLGRVPVGAEPVQVRPLHLSRLQVKNVVIDRGLARQSWIRRLAVQEVLLTVRKVIVADGEAGGNRRTVELKKAFLATLDLRSLQLSARKQERNERATHLREPM